jgi:glycerophosphoryl diester phosphodiesterase
MKTYFKTCILLFIIGISNLLQAQSNSGLEKSRANIILDHLKHPSKNYVLAVSHRGNWRYAPENSLQAIQSCIDLGVDIVEIDVRLTKDGHLVLMHDKTVDRTTNGKGKVSDFTLEEIKKLRLKNACGVQYSMQQVPTLEEVMLLAKDKIMINLDKVEGETVREAYGVLQKTATVDQAIFKGRDSVEFMKNKYGKLMDSIIYMPILIDNTKNPEKYVDDYNKELSPIAYEVTFPTEDSNNFKLISKLNKMGITVLNIALWDALVAGHTDEMKLLNGADTSWGWLVQHGANGIMTDRPEELLDYLREKGLHN